MQAFNKDELHTSYMDRCVCVCVCVCMCVCVCVYMYACSHSVMSDSLQPTLCSWTAALQAPWPMGFSRQGNWSGLHFLLQGIFPTQGSSPHSCISCTNRQVLTAMPPEKPTYLCYIGFFFLCVHKNIDEYTQKRRDSKKLGYFHFL